MPTWLCARCSVGSDNNNLQRTEFRLQTSDKCFETGIQMGYSIGKCYYLKSEVFSLKSFSVILPPPFPPKAGSLPLSFALPHRHLSSMDASILLPSVQVRFRGGRGERLPIFSFFIFHFSFFHSFILYSFIVSFFILSFFIPHVPILPPQRFQRRGRTDTAPIRRQELAGHLPPVRLQPRVHQQEHSALQLFPLRSGAWPHPSRRCRHPSPALPQRRTHGRRHRRFTHHHRDDDSRGLPRGV